MSFRPLQIKYAQLVTVDEAAEQADAKKAYEAATNGSATTNAKIIYGMELVELNPAIAARFGVKQTKGLLVADLAKGSNAADAGLVPGSVIVKADGGELTKIAQLEQAVAKLKKSGKKSVLLLVQNGTNAGFIALPI